jgi:hypothetical protein
MKKIVIDANLLLFDNADLPQGAGAGSDPDKLSTAILITCPGTIEIKADDAITVETAKSFNIEILQGDTATTCAAPDDGHQFAFYKDSDDDEKVIAADARIGREIAIGHEWMGKYLQLKIETDADLSASGITAWFNPII